MIGQTLSHFKITAKLGEGGMGEVYRAQDTKLKREVALKILPPELAASQERLERFQREAEALAALDHPNIVTIHSVEEDESVHFLTMQLVEGKQLTDVIPQRGMSLERIFEIAIPLADALAAAHEKGVIHRDLKPGNIMVTDEGRVKVLDFGLAKLRQGPVGAEATQLPTEPLTDEGRVLGTAPYMSPEQVEGQPLDSRSDLFSLGVILYEMATGERPFRGGSPASVMSAILSETPAPVTEVRDVLPRQLARIIRRCLVKKPERRFQTARELAIELEELRSEVASGEAWPAAVRPPRRSGVFRRPGWSVVGIALLAALAVVLFVRRRDRVTTEELPAVRTTFTKLVIDTSEKGIVSASPDGRFFVWASDGSGNWDIYLRLIAGGNAINLTEDSAADDRQPAFSPDGGSIAFRSEREGGGIFIMAATGGLARRVTDHGYFPSWSPDGRKILFETSWTGVTWAGDEDQRSWIVDLESGEERLLLDTSAQNPAWSPDGRWIAYRASWRNQYDLFLVSADGGVPIALTDDTHREWAPVWSSDGQSLYYVTERGGGRDLWRMRIDAKAGRRLGDQEPVTSGGNVMQASPLNDGRRILYLQAVASREIFKVPFDPVEEKVTGPQVSITPGALQAGIPTVSPDGEWIAFHAEFGHLGSWAIGVVRKDGTDLRQVTQSGHRDLYPDWSPDGKQLAFYGGRSGSPFQAWIVNVDGSGLRLLTDTAGIRVYEPTWSPDGSRLTLCHVDVAKGEPPYLSGAVRPWSEEPPTRLPRLGDRKEGFCPNSWSPDGRFLAGVTLSSLDAASAPKVAIFSVDSQSYDVLMETSVLGHADVNPRWLADGRRLFLQRENGVYSVLDTETGEVRDVLSLDVPGERPESGAHTDQGDISPDNRTIYFDWNRFESAIAMLTLEDGE